MIGIRLSQKLSYTSSSSKASGNRKVLLLTRQEPLRLLFRKASNTCKIHFTHRHSRVLPYESYFFFKVITHFPMPYALKVFVGFLKFGNLCRVCGYKLLLLNYKSHLRVTCLNDGSGYSQCQRLANKTRLYLPLILTWVKTR